MIGGVEITPQRQRTRTAILDAAAVELARDPAASIGRIATTAGVGRATVHRYFADRAQLQATLVSDSWRLLHDAITQAGLGAGSTLEVIDRIVTAMVDVGDRVLFLFAATEGDVAERDAALAASVDEAVIAEITRGQRTGELDATVAPQWIERVVWSIVYTGLHAARDRLASRHGIADLIRWTLRGAIAARTTPVPPAAP
jgi:AcrR family transcriptional regulator